MIRKIEIVECPACGHKINGSFGINCKTPPVPNDVSICMYCGCISEFDENLNLTILSEKTLLQPEYREAIEMREKVRAYRGMKTRQI